MENLFDNKLSIPADCINGFHQYSLESPVHLTFASKSFCEITGYSEDELLSDSNDMLENIVHPADIDIYRKLLKGLSENAKTQSAEYRIIRKDGTVRYLCDTIISKRNESGVMQGYSVSNDITALKNENTNLRFLNDTIPCGFLKYTCEKNPRITYISNQLLKMLGFPENTDCFEMYKDNIYLMIPMEHRRKFSHFLKQVDLLGGPISGEIQVLRYDGTKAVLYGWVTKVTNEHGDYEFQSVCIDVTEKANAKKADVTERYLKALSDVYNKIYKYDYTDSSVTYIHSSKSDTFSRIKNVPMHLKQASLQWINSIVVPKDRECVLEFFENIVFKNNYDDTKKPPQIRYSTITKDGSTTSNIGIFLRLDSNSALYCVRNVAESTEADNLRSENLSLKNINENMQELVWKFTEGIVAFEVDGEYVKPLYASDNVCKFFGYSKEEWILLTKQSIKLKEFISQSNVPYSDFQKLFEKGNAEFSYTDVATKKPHRIKAVCSHKSSQSNSPRYVMLYKIDDLSQNNTDAKENSRVYIRTFGYFDVFVNEQPIAFRNKKSKELLALLVDRKGGFISSEEAISFLWEDEPVSTVTLARYRKVALRLKNILEEYAISDIVETIDGKRRIVTEKVQCDLYDYLSQEDEFSGLFKGSYLTNYSWGEMTLGELLCD